MRKRAIESVQRRQHRTWIKCRTAEASRKKITKRRDCLAMDDAPSGKPIEIAEQQPRRVSLRRVVLRRRRVLDPRAPCNRLIVKDAIGHGRNQADEWFDHDDASTAGHRRPRALEKCPRRGEM